MTLEKALEKIAPLDQQAKARAQSRWNGIAHPLHSLGRLEEIVIQMAAIAGDADVHTPKKALIVMCADNGVVAEGVTQTGQEVTAIVAENFLSTKATAAIFCKNTGADIFPIDIGVARDTKIIQRKIAYGTKNMAKEPAMTREQTVKAIEVGIDFVGELKEKGYQLIATGEMGIGNTTTSSAVVSVLLEQPAEEVTGKGAGLSNDALKRKIEVIKSAIARHHPLKTDAIDVLSKVGGLDLAGLAGIFIGGAVYRIPVVMDGFISAAAALTASVITPLAKPYMIASHVSKEPAAEKILQALGVKPALCCDMCLGEGTGAVALFPLVDLGIAVYQGMGTFGENAIEQYEEWDLL